MLLSKHPRYSFLLSAIKAWTMWHDLLQSLVLSENPSLPRRILELPTKNLIIYIMPILGDSLLYKCEIAL